MFLEILQKFTSKRLCQSLFFNKVTGLWPSTLLKKKTLALVFSCEFCEISKNTFSQRTPPVAASEKIVRLAGEKGYEPLTTETGF